MNRQPRTHAAIWALLISLVSATPFRLVAQDAQPVQAAPALKDLSLEELGQVRVTTFSKTPTNLWQTPAAIYIISSEDIQRSGVTNIADALRLAPGVEVGRMNSTTWAVGIRGLQNNFSKSVLVLIDGRNVYTPLFAGVYWDVQDMPLDDIDHIEVIRGPAGTIWGPNSANGVINIVTRKASETQHTQANGLAGTQDKTIDDLQYGSSIRGTDFRVYGRGFDRRHEYHTDGINDDDWHQERLGFRVDRTTGPSAFFTDGTVYRGNSPHIIGSTPFNDEVSGGDLNFRWERAPASGSDTYVQAYFDRTLRTKGLVGETRNTWDIDFLQNLHAGEKQTFSVGAGLRWSPYRISPQNPGQTLVPATNLDHVYTAFAQDEIHFSPQVALTLGAKLEHNNYSGLDVLPSGRLLWSPSEHQSLWMGITRSVTTPSDIERGFLLEAPVSPTVVVQVLGNPHFQSENVVGYELGYRRLLNSHLYVDIATFWNQYSRLQSFSAEMMTMVGNVTYYTIQYENQIAGSASGFEIAPKFTLTRNWKLNMSYSYLNSDFTANGATSDISSTGSVNTYNHSSPKHDVFLQSELDLPAKFQFDQTYRYVSALPAQKVAAYQTMDARFGRHLGSYFSFDVVGQNLFQPHHNEWGTGDPTQPVIGIYRAAYVQISYRGKP